MAGRTLPVAAAVVATMLLVLGCTTAPLPTASPEPTSTPPPTATPVPTVPSTPIQSPLPTPMPSPSASPTAEATELHVLSTAEFAAALDGGGLRGKTVLVNGSVPQNELDVFCSPPDFSPPPPDFSCPLGVLAGTDPPIYVWYELWAERANEGAHFDGGDITWPWWDGPDWPVEGTLVLSVTDGSDVRFVGRAHDPEQELVRSVADAVALDINSVGPDEVVLIDGWLSGWGQVFSCLNPGATVAGLPSRWCAPAGVLFDQPTRVEDPAWPASLGLQGNAYWDFAPNPWPASPVTGNGEPRAGLYAVTRRLEGWCPAGDPPCWEWNLVARMEPNPIAAAVPTPPVATSFECGGSRGVALVDAAGIVVACRAVEGMLADDNPWAPTVTNPDGDHSRLQVTWGTSACVTKALGILTRSGSAYEMSLRLTEIPTVPPCEGPPIAMGFELDLRDNVDAGRLTATFEEPLRSDYMPDELIVTSCEWPMDAVDQFATEYGLTLDQVHEPPASFYVFRILDGTDPMIKAAIVARDPVVCGATPDWIGVLF